jgi:uncharacterized protein (TIGR03083 family)
MSGDLSFEGGHILPVLNNECELLLTALDVTEPSAPVPMCPGWTAVDLAAHLGGVLRWVNVVIAEQRTEPPVGDERRALFADPDPTDYPGVVKRLREATTAITASLSAAPTDLRCWTIWPAPAGARQFWLRRMLHEVVVHRFDAQNARAQRVSDGNDVDGTVATDGVDELMQGFAGRYTNNLRAERVVLLAVDAHDAGRQWWARIGPDAPEFGRGRTESADATVRGNAGELLLLLWNRRDAAGLDIEGDPSVLDIWRAGAHL